jgi:agmatinase
MTGYPDWASISSSGRVRGKIFPRLAEDMPTFLGAPVAISPADLAGADVAIIGAPFASGWGKKYGDVDKDEWLAGPKRVR